MNRASLLLLAFSVLSSSLAHSASLPAWSIGQKWKVEVTTYSRDYILSFSDPKLEVQKNTPRIKAVYGVTVTVVGKESLDGRECWYLDFDQRNKDWSFRLWIDSLSGSVRAVRQLGASDQPNVSIASFGDISVLRDSPFGCPLDFLPPSVASASLKDNDSGGGRSLDIELASDPQKQLVTVDYALKSDSREVNRVVLRWREGGAWWSEYEKYEQGHLQLKAYLQEEK